jgi:hypothetical protein
VSRVTADSNVYISALIWGGKPLQLLELALTPRLFMVSSATSRPRVAAAARNDFRTRTSARECLHQRAGAPPRPSVIGYGDGPTVSRAVAVGLPVVQHDGGWVVHARISIQGKGCRDEHEDG